MKKIITLVSIFLMSMFCIAEESNILGIWKTEVVDSNRITVKIYVDKNGKYNGKIIELLSPKHEEGEHKGKDKMDINNPKENLKTRKLVGIDFVSGFNYDKNNKIYENGKIYDPSSGKTYHSTMKINSNGTLRVRGTIDSLGLLGKTQTWTRVK